MSRLPAPEIFGTGVPTQGIVRLLALWHLRSAAGLYALFRFYAELEPGASP